MCDTLVHMTKQTKIIIGLILSILIISGGIAYKKHQEASLDIAIISVEGMTCESCEKAIEVSVKKNKAVKHVEANHKAGQVVLTYNKDKITEKDLKELIRQSGYTVPEPKDKLIINEAKIKFIHQ